MIESGGIGNREEFEVWLEGKPIEWAQVIAVRSAMRVLPLVVEVLDAEKLGKNHRQSLIFATFRATLISWAARRYPAHDMRVASAAAATAAIASNASVAANASAAATAAVHATANVSKNAAAYAATYAAAAASDPNIWEAINRDIVFLEARKDRPPLAARGLVSTWLWVDENGKRNTPDWYKEKNRELVSRLIALDDNWHVWTDWHNNGLRSSTHWGLQAKEAEKLVLLIVDQNNDWWNRGPSAVNADIAGWLVELRKETKTSKSAPENVKEATISNQREEIKTESTIDQSPGEGGEGDEGHYEPSPNTTPELPWLSDGIDPNVDHLARSGMGFALAVRINEIWDALNKPENEPSKFPSWDWWKKQAMRFDPRPIWRGARQVRLEPGFVVHLDAPWGGGKTSFANFLANILNPSRIKGELPEWLQKLNLAANLPDDYQRQWHIVQFNAWQHQHVSPPWWVFYETIRRQCGTSLFSSRGSYSGATGNKWHAPFIDKVNAARLWGLEFLWRLWSPSTRIGLGISVVVGFIVYILISWNLISFDLTKLNFTANNSDGNGGIIWSTLIMLLMGAAAPLITIIKAFTSTLLPGTPAAAKNYSLGSGDPLERFRRHFARMMERYRRPILVVVDDLDRCSPEFVVDLVRGMQTILVSPRVVFLLLGDRDWIEKSFSEVHKTMKGIDVGPEHEFGARFVEKAIQLSFVLPDITEEERETYVRRLLTPEVREEDQQKEPDDAADKALEKLKQDLKVALETDDFSQRKEAVVQVTKSAKESDLLSDEESEQFIDESADELFLKEASDKSLLLEAATRIKGLSVILPANPRQIKRIINTLSLLMVIAERKYGSAGQSGEDEGWADNDWQILARWVVLMVEWPKTWFTLSKYPGLADLVLSEDETEGAAIASTSLSDEATATLVARIKACKPVIQILTFDDADNGWDAGDITTDKITGWLSVLTPPTSGEMLDGTNGKE